MTTETVSFPVTAVLAPHEYTEVWPPGIELFREGEEPAGVYVLHEGKVDLTFSVPRSGDACPLLIADAGQILGITCVMSGRRHDCSAVTRTPCATGFIDKDQFLKLLDDTPDLWLSVLRMISTNINACWDCMRELATR